MVRGRLWRASNPYLPEDQREQLVRALMAARRAVRDAKDNPDALTTARAQVHQAKVGLGERGAVWWTDGAPDFNRKLARNTPYAAWAEQLEAKAARTDEPIGQPRPSP